MTETMLVRTATGGWEELRAQSSVPDGGIVELFGEDVGPVFAAPIPVIVAAARPQLAGATPDALCVDTTGGVWVLQLALDGDGADTLPQLLACAGSLTGMGWSAFEHLCDRRGTDTLDAFVEARASGQPFQRAAFQSAVTDALAHGRIHFVAVVRDAAPTLIQSMRFLTASGALGSIFEASSFASASVTAIRAKAVDVGAQIAPAAAAPADQPTAAPTATAPATAAASTPERTPRQATAKREPAKADPAAAFIAATAATTDDATAALMQQLQASCVNTCDEISYTGSASAPELHAGMRTADGAASFVTAQADGAVILSFEALGVLDPDWTVRAELCQGMERLLGTDLGDVRKISQLNLSIGEHLMDATLMEALIELLADTTRTLRDSMPVAA